MTRCFLLLASILFAAGCAPDEQANQPVKKPSRGAKQVLIINGKYQADPGVKLLERRPPETEEEYVAQFGESPELLFVKGEDRFYRYVKGRLQPVETISHTGEVP